MSGPKHQSLENKFLQEPNDLNIANDFKFSKSKNNVEKNRDDSQFERMEKLREGLQNQPHFDFGIPLNENSSLSLIQKFKEKKRNKREFRKYFAKN